MRPVTRLPLLIAALAVPIAVVLFSYAMTNGPRTPQVPAEVHVGDTSGPSPDFPGTPAPAPATSTSPPADLPPPEPEDDDDEPDDDIDHDD